MNGLLKGYDQRSQPSLAAHLTRVLGAFLADRFIVGLCHLDRAVKARDNRVVKAVAHDTSGRDGNLRVIPPARPYHHLAVTLGTGPGAGGSRPGRWVAV